MKIALRLALIAVLFFAIKLNQDSIDAQRAETDDKKPKLLFMPQRNVMRVLSFGHGGTASDLLFIRTLNYVVKDLDKVSNPLYLNRLFETLVALDPQAESRYCIGNLFLSAIAQRHQAGLNLLAIADGRHYKIASDGSIHKSAAIKKKSKPDWLNFKGRLIYNYDTGGQLHPKHPRAWLVNRTRAIYFITMKRDYKHAGEEYLQAAKSWGLDPKLRENWKVSGKTLIDFVGRMSERRQLQISKEELEMSLSITTEEKLRVLLEVQLKAIDARFDELTIEKQRVAIYQTASLKVNSLRELKAAITDPIVIEILNNLHNPFSPDQPEDYVFFPDGRVRSPARVIAKANRILMERFRDFEEKNQRRRPKSFAEMDINPEKDLPKEVKASYNSETGTFKVIFLKR
jgi:hypothetical protein